MGGGWCGGRTAGGSSSGPTAARVDPSPPRPHLGAAPAADLRAAQADLHVTPDSLLPTWDGTPVDYVWGARALRRLEAAATREAAAP